MAAVGQEAVGPEEVEVGPVNHLEVVVGRVGAAAAFLPTGQPSLMAAVVAGHADPATRLGAPNGLAEVA